MIRFLHRDSIFFKLFFSQAFTGFIIILVSLLLYFNTQWKTTNANTRVEIERIRDNAVTVLEQGYLSRIRSALSTMAISPSLKNFRLLPENETTPIRFDIEQQFVQLVKSGEGIFESIRFIDRMGQEKITVVGNRRVRKRRSLFSADLSKEDEIIHSVFIQLAKSKPGDIFFSPLHVDENSQYHFYAGIALYEPDIGGFGGVLVAAGRLDDYVERLREQSYQQQPVVSLNLVQDPLFSLSNRHRAESLLFDIEDEITVYDYKLNAGGKDVFLQFLSRIPAELLLREYNHLIRTALLVSAIGLVMIFLLAWWLTLRIVRPLDHLVAVSQRFSRGDFAPIAIDSDKGEIGQLFVAMNAMAGQLQQSIASRDRDIEQRKAIEKELSLHRQQLENEVSERTRELVIAKEIAEHSNAAKSRFLANMSHELRTPMHAIVNYTGLVLKREQDEKSVRFLENVLVSARRLTGLLDDLLDLSKLESGKMQLNLVTDSDLAGLTRQIVSSLESLINEKQLKLDIAHPGDTSGCYDPKLMAQVITNLLSNAIKFAPGGSSISIRLDRTSAELMNRQQQVLAFNISDEGVGIPDKEIDAIFDRFVQSSKTVSNSGGTGLGLPICREIIHLHQGKIWAASPAQGNTPGKDSLPGASFHFIIPVNP